MVQTWEPDGSCEGGVSADECQYYRPENDCADAARGEAGFAATRFVSPAAVGHEGALAVAADGLDAVIHSVSNELVMP